MEFKEFYERLGKTILRYAEIPDGMEDSIEIFDSKAIAEAANSASRDIVKTASFDDKGEWSCQISMYCPLSIEALGQIRNLSLTEASYDIVITTNYPERFEHHNVKAGEYLIYTLKTNAFSNTKIRVSIKSTVPNSAAVFKLHCVI